jgi:lipopolysaccharide assembly outer membrane protein LptD (OstA)
MFASCGQLKRAVFPDTSPDSALFTDTVPDTTLPTDTLPASTLPTDTLRTDSLFAASKRTDSLRLPTDSIGALLADSLRTDSLRTDSLRTDSLLSDSLFADSLRTDSLHLPVDSLGKVPADTVRKSPSAIEAPVNYTAKDSTVMLMKSGNRIYMYGDAEVHYTNLELKAENIVVDADSSILTATSARDSLGVEFGYPAFTEGGEKYEFRKARYNFKTKRLASTDIITTQNDGYITAVRAKKMENNEMYMENGRFTTCEDVEHPHYYFQMSKAMVEPGKRVAFGPTWLVMEDVPLPVAIPFGFFPFSTDNASSGLIFPTYADEMKRGFALRDGGWYFAIRDYVDLALTGEYFTRGSWGINARSNYRKRYKFSGNFQASYLVTITGEKEDVDYSKATDMRITWSHSQDPKANPFSTFSASVNYSTS